MTHRRLPVYSRWLLALAVVLLCGLISLFFEKHKVLAFSGSGGGTSEGNPYIIMNADQLNEVRNDKSGYYRLGADIDLEGTAYAAGGGWVPIGDNLNGAFSGWFDGNGHTISHLRINSNGNSLGLFGNVTGATIRNLGLIDVEIKGGTDNDNVGGLAGQAVNTTIRYVYVTGKVSAYESVGGLVGNLSGNSSIVSDSYAAVEMSGTDDVGGLVGFSQGSPTVYRSYWDFGLTLNSVLGIALTPTEMKQAESFVGWQFSEEDGQWGIIEGVTYPMLRAQFDRIVLDSLTINAGGVPLDPPFASDGFAYSARVTSDINSVAVTAVPIGGSSTVSINGLSDSETIILDSVVNTVPISVSTVGIALPGTTDDPFEVEYTLTIVREDGTASYPHSISTADQLAAIGTGTYGMGDHYRLIEDLDLTGYDWQPIGDGDTPFAGQFDGNGHIINHLTIDLGTADRVGLFGQSVGEIMNVGLENVHVNGKSQVGALIGENAGTAANVYSLGEVTGDNDVGGLIGLNSGVGSLNYAYFVGWAADSGNVGGLIGRHSSTGTVSDSYYTLSSGLTASSAGGVEKTAADMRLKSTYSGWDFDHTWAIMNGTTYPMWKSHFDAVKLTGIAVTPSNVLTDWTPTPFSSAQGAYTIVLDHYVKEVDIAATAADSGAVLDIDGESGTTLTKSVLPGDNVVLVRISKPGVAVEGTYLLNIQVPGPAITGVATTGGYYGSGDIIVLTVSYEDDVAVTGGTPRLPIRIGTETVYALYAGQPDGDASQLKFEYEVPEGLADTDGIELVTPIDLPAGAAITANGQDVPLGFAVPVMSGVRIDSIAPSVTLSQTPDSGTLINGSVTIAANVEDSDSGIAAAKWSEGTRSAAFFASGGTTLVGGSFEAGANGTYTVYARDVAGNETVATIEVGNIVSVIPDIHWGYAPTTVTNGAVTISVTAAVYAGGTANTLTKLNWLPESRLAADFAGGTIGADLVSEPQFTVASNGIYTVYARDAAGNEAVKEIPIGNIVTEAPDLTLCCSPDAAMSGPVTITVTATVYGVAAGNSLAELRWLPGGKNSADFAGGSQGSDMIATHRFAVSSNGEYTVYARDAAGNEAVKRIAIANVVAPSKAAGDNEDAGAAPCRSGSCLYLRAGAAGELSIDGITIEIPAGATDTDLTLTLEPVTLPDDSPIYVGQHFLSPVFEALKTSEGKFLKPVTLRIAYLPAEVQQGRLALVFYYDEAAEQWIRIGGEPQDRAIAAQVDHFTKFAVLAVDEPSSGPAAPSVFSDIEGHWAQKAILEAVERGIIQGYPDGTFRPDKPVTRAEFAVMLMKRLDWEAPNGPELTFRDRTDIPSWALAAIEAAVQQGVMGGYPDHTIRPNAPILRTEMAVMLARAMQLPRAESPGIAFQDSDAIPAWARPYVTAVEQAGIMQGDDRQRFNPAAGTTRAEAAAVLVKSLIVEGGRIR